VALVVAGAVELASTVAPAVELLIKWRPQVQGSQVKVLQVVLELALKPKSTEAVAVAVPRLRVPTPQILSTRLETVATERPLRLPAPQPGTRRVVEVDPVVFILPDLAASQAVVGAVQTSTAPMELC
jgi:hypothetical protein